MCAPLLGHLGEFQSQISGPIMRGREEGAAEWVREQGERARGALAELLRHVLLRRTQADVLHKALPPRRDIILFCALGPLQAQQYDSKARDIMR